MSEGNSVASIPNAGGMAPAFEEDACAKLDKKNKENRETVTETLKAKPDPTQEEQNTLAKAQGPGMTFSSAQSQVPGASGTFSACSSACAQGCAPSQLDVGGTSAQRQGLNAATRASDDPQHDAAKAEAGVLCDKSHVHPGGGKGAHAEPKIMNQMTTNFPNAPMRGGSMLFSIDWRFNEGGQVQQSGMPCAHCYKMMCHAATECDIAIFVCDKEQNPQPLSKEDCKDPNGYENLCVRVDGGPVPGRLPLA